MSDNARLPPPMSAREWAAVARDRKTEIEALRDEISLLKEALKPFAEEVAMLDNHYDCNDRPYAGGLKCGHLRAARDALIK